MGLQTLQPLIIVALRLALVEIRSFDFCIHAKRLLSYLNRKDNGRYFNILRTYGRAFATGFPRIDCRLFIARTVPLLFYAHSLFISRFSSFLLLRGGLAGPRGFRLREGVPVVPGARRPQGHPPPHQALGAGASYRPRG